MENSASRFVFGIPTVRRRRDYLKETVESLVSELPKDTSLAQIVIFNAEPNPHFHVAVQEVEREYPELVGSHFLNILTAPTLDREPPGLDGRIDETDPDVRYERWREKLVLDCALLFGLCKGRGEYYVHLEDDVIAAEGFWPKLISWFDAYFAERDDWSALCLYTHLDLTDRQPYPLDLFSGLPGLLLRCRDLELAAHYLVKHSRRAPCDWLLRDFFKETRKQVYARVPSLIQHVGVVSSLPGKVQPYESPTFEETPLKKARRRATAIRDLLQHVRPGVWHYLRTRGPGRRCFRKLLTKWC
jgi:alpha-1,3-mannosylglycoprotein beta-1,4-N-acetylglucosaminyltransferase A/B